MSSQSTSLRFRQGQTRVPELKVAPVLPLQKRTGPKRPLEMLLDLAADEDYFDLRQAAEFARTCCVDHSDFEEAILGAIESENTSIEQAIRLIRILEVNCHKTKLLGHLLQLQATEPRVNSKIKLTVGRLVQNTAWLREQLTDAEPRTRANAVEALWNVRMEGVEELLWSAAEDMNNRVVANAACGLYKLGFVEASEILHFLLRHRDPKFRRSGIWAVTHLGDSRFIRALRHLDEIPDMAEDEKTLREAASKHLANKLEIARFSDSVQITVNSSAVSSRGRRIVQVSCTPSFPNVSFTPETIDATHFQVEEDGSLIDRFDFQWSKPTEQVPCFVLAPEGLGLGLWETRKAQASDVDLCLSIVRFQLTSDIALSKHADQKMVCGRLGGLKIFRSLPTLSQALARAANAAKELDRQAHVFVAINRSQCELPTSALQKTIRAARIVLHAFVANDADEKLQKSFAKLCADTNGTFFSASSVQLLASHIHRVRSQHLTQLTLSWQGEKQKPQAIVIRFVGPQGYGEATLDSGRDFKAGDKSSRNVTALGGRSVK